MSPEPTDVITSKHHVLMTNITNMQVSFEQHHKLNSEACSLIVPLPQIGCLQLFCMEQTRNFHDILLNYCVTHSYVVLYDENSFSTALLFLSLLSSKPLPQTEKHCPQNINHIHKYFLFIQIFSLVCNIPS